MRDAVYRFGGYFVVRVPRNATHKELQKRILHKMASSIVGCDVPSDVSCSLIGPF